MNERYRVLFVGTHAVQYSAPVFRRMAQHRQLDFLVAYCSLQGAERGVDPEFGVEVSWDIPLLEGYPWVEVPNRSLRPGLGRFFGLFNPGLWKLVRNGDFDAIVSLTGYNYASFWIAAMAAKVYRKPLLFGTDAHEIGSRDQRGWKRGLKRRLWPRLFRLADVVIVLSTGGAEMMHSLGLPEERVVLTPYVVNNDWWIEQARRVDRAAVRQGWGLPEDARVVLFCAKLQPWKRPQDVLLAFSKAAVPGSYLVYAGEGPLRAQLEAEARGRNLSERVKFLGFANQTQLPSIYKASDLFVLPSDYEPFGVVVNEAMLCSCPVVVSDRVGAGYDLVVPGQTGFVFPTGDVEALARILQETLPAGERLRQMGEAGRERMQTWSPHEYVNSLLDAIGRAVRRKANGNARLGQ